MHERTGAGAGVTVLTNGEAQLRFTREPAGHCFMSWVRVHDHWVGAALWPNALGEGVLALVPGAIEASGGVWLVQGEGTGTGLDGSPVGFEWAGSIAPVAGDGWAVDVDFDTPVPLHGPASLVLWLGALSTMSDRQALTWRRTFVAGPTRNGQGLSGNDLPALYLLDSATGVETILAYDAEALSWAAGRLLTLQCRELYEYGLWPRYGVGLIRLP